MDLSLQALSKMADQAALSVKHWQFGNKAQLAFLEDLSVLINDGIPANRAIEMMSQATTGLTREVALSLLKKIGQGQPLADGMRDWFHLNIVEIVRAGESGGALSQTLKSSINMLSQRGMAIGSFIGAMTYPLLVIAIACFVIVYLNTSVFEQFRAIKPMALWPEAGKRLVLLADIIQNWWWVVVASVIGFLVFMQQTFQNYIGELRSTLDQFFPFTLYRRLVAARFLETLGLLVSNGVVFKAAIKVMQHQANPYLNSHLVMMEHLLSMGKNNIADVFDTGLLQDQELMRLRVMAEVKGFEHGLMRMGLRGSEQAIETLKYISRFVGGIFLIVGALLIITIVQGIYMTAMSMGTQ